MKTLILVRHAKSSHSFGTSNDFDRPLNDRGFREAAEMGKNYSKKIYPSISLYQALHCGRRQRRNFLQGNSRAN